MWSIFKDFIENQFISSPIGFGGFILASLSLFIHYKNRTTNKKTYYLNRDNKRKSSIELLHISATQVESSIINKLVVFNPSSNGLILQSLQVYKEYKSNFPILQEYGLIKKWDKVKSTWWPTTDESNFEPKFIEDEFRNLFVKDIRLIVVSIDGYIDRDLYKFHLKTGHEEISRITTINGFQTQFAHEFYRKYKKD